jgi:hypothetical protein
MPGSCLVIAGTQVYVQQHSGSWVLSEAVLTGNFSEFADPSTSESESDAQASDGVAGQTGVGLLTPSPGASLVALTAQNVDGTPTTTAGASPGGTQSETNADSTVATQTTPTQPTSSTSQPTTGQASSCGTAGALDIAVHATSCGIAAQVITEAGRASSCLVGDSYGYAATGSCTVASGFSCKSKLGYLPGRPYTGEAGPVFACVNDAGARISWYVQF